MSGSLVCRCVVDADAVLKVKARLAGEMSSPELRQCPYHPVAGKLGAIRQNDDSGRRRCPRSLEADIRAQFDAAHSVTAGNRVGNLRRHAAHEDTRRHFDTVTSHPRWLALAAKFHADEAAADDADAASRAKLCPDRQGFGECAQVERLRRSRDAKLARPRTRRQQELSIGNAASVFQLNERFGAIDGCCRHAAKNSICSFLARDARRVRPARSARPWRSSRPSTAAAGRRAAPAPRRSA